MCWGDRVPGSVLSVARRAGQLEALFQRLDCDGDGVVSGRDLFEVLVHRPSMMRMKGIGGVVRHHHSTAATEAHKAAVSEAAVWAVRATVGMEAQASSATGRTNHRLWLR